MSAITALQTKSGELHVRTKEGLAIFELGPQADKWREKITNPKSLLEKLGVKLGQSVAVIGDFSPDLFESLEKHGALITKGKVAKDSNWILLEANEKQELRRLPSVVQSLQGTTALWLVYPKRQQSITETDVRSAGLKVGLVDIKAASFSATHTALKFVLPKSKR